MRICSCRPSFATTLYETHLLLLVMERKMYDQAYQESSCDDSKSKGSSEHEEAESENNSQVSGRRVKGKAAKVKEEKQSRESTSRKRQSVRQAYPSFFLYTPRYYGNDIDSDVKI